MRRAVFNMRDDRPARATPPWAVARLREALGEGWEVVDVQAPVSGRGDGSGLSDEALRAMPGAEIYFGLSMPRELVQAALRPPALLKWVHSGAAGIASLLHPELSANKITFTNSAGIHAPAMAETTLGMILHFFRGFDYATRAQYAREWSVEPFESTTSGIREVGGATLGIIGYGGIGRELARRAAGLDMHVIATRRRNLPAEHAQVVSLDELLVQSDVVVITAPATPETRGLIGAREIALMKPDALLVNVGRGEVLDEHALIAALQRGHLRGAALDVFEVEPLPSNSPLWTMENVLIIPHASATSPWYWEREMALILDNVERYVRGEELRNVVDLEAGY